MTQNSDDTKQKIGASDTLDRFAKVCELLASPSDGERAVAASKASSMLFAMGLTWSELVAMAINLRAPGLEPSASHDHNALIDELLDGIDHLTDWEISFADGLDEGYRDGSLSHKQWVVLERLIKKVRAASSGSAS